MSDRQYPLSGASNSRGVRFLADGPLVPLDLVRARDAGEVVFIVGAGVSRGSGLPLFQELTRDVYRQLTGDDPAIGGAIPHAEKKAYDGWSFDVALGLLEERYDGDAVNAAAPSRRVREAVAQALDAGHAADLKSHRHLLMLGRDARMRPRLITTNFDLLFEHAWPTVCGDSLPLQSRANTNLPQPGDHDFFGVLHLHGRLGDPRLTPPLTETELVLTSADFGEAYLRDGWAARFLYDLVRRYHLVLVGYGAEDPPLKYLLSVIAAHRRRFTDLKTLYAFAGAASGDSDAVAAEWLAKGIMPLLYETDHGHQPLYGTLAEWAMSVDFSDVWAERHFRSIGATPYHQAKPHERDALQLLLQSRQRCTEFSKAGGDFSWVRAIEETFGRHRPGDLPDEIHTSSSREAPPAYRAAFRAWAHDRLDSAGAIAWAVERLAPSRPVVSMTDATADTSAEADQTTVVKGFTPNELDDLKHIFDRTAAAWSASTRRFWSILLQVAEDRLQFEARGYASPILKRLQTAGTEPDPADAQRLALFLRPVAMVDWARQGPAKGIEESASAGDPFALVSFSMGWRGHPNDREIAAALPAEPRWLTSLLRSLEAEIDRTYRLAGQIGWLGSRDRLSGTLRRVARDPSWWNGEEAGNGGPNDPDTYARPQRNLVRVTSAAWDCLATVDEDAARRIAAGWGARTESLFARLHLHTLRNTQVWDGDAAATVLSALDDAALWLGPAEVEVLLLARWQTLPERAREALESRLRNGPPLALHPAAATGQAEAWQKDRADRRLSVLGAAGGPLSAESRERVATYRARMAAEAASDAADLSPRVSRASWSEPGDASVFAGLAGAELLAAIDAHGTGRDGEWGAETPIGPLLRSDPERVLRALVDVDGGRGHGRLWNALFRRLAFPETTEAVCNATKETMLCAVVAMQDVPLADAASAVTEWLGGLVKGDDEATITFLENHQALVVEAWERVAELALNENEEVEVYGPDQGERLMTDALNSVAGALGFTGLVLADKGQRFPDRLAALFGARGTIDTRLQGTEGATGPLVAAQLAERLEIAASLLPEATEKLVLVPLTGDQVTDAGGLVLLDLFALYSLEMTPAIYRRLESRLLEEVKAERLSAKAVDNLVAMLTFRTLDRLAGVTDEAPTPDAMRKALQQTSESARAASAVALENWLRAKPDADRAASWRGPGAMFFRTVWPLEAVLRTPAVSEALSQIPVVAGDAFPEAVNTIRPLLVPFTLWEMVSVLLDRATAEAEISADSEALNLSFEHWPAALTLVDAVVGPAPITVPYDLSIWLTYLAKRTPEAANNPMFRRLQGLRHR